MPDATSWRWRKLLSPLSVVAMILFALLHLRPAAFGEHGGADAGWGSTGFCGSMWSDRVFGPVSLVSCGPAHPRGHRTQPAVWRHLLLYPEPQAVARLKDGGLLTKAGGHALDAPLRQGSGLQSRQFWSAPGHLAFFRLPPGISILSLSRFSVLPGTTTRTRPRCPGRGGRD